MRRLYPPTRWLVPVQRGLVRTLVAGERIEDESVVHRVALRMTDRVAAMPWLLCWGIVGLTMCFELLVLLRRLRRFGSLPAERRTAHVASWREHSVGLFRDWVEFHERMLSFLWYSEPEARERLGPGGMR